MLHLALAEKAIFFTIQLIFAIIQLIFATIHEFGG